MLDSIVPGRVESTDPGLIAGKKCKERQWAGRLARIYQPALPLVSTFATSAFNKAPGGVRKGGNFYGYASSCTSPGLATVKRTDAFSRGPCHGFPREHA